MGHYVFLDSPRAMAHRPGSRSWLAIISGDACIKTRRLSDMSTFHQTIWYRVAKKWYWSRILSFGFDITRRCVGGGGVFHNVQDQADSRSLSPETFASMLYVVKYIVSVQYRRFGACCFVFNVEYECLVGLWPSRVNGLSVLLDAQESCYFMMV